MDVVPAAESPNLYFLDLVSSGPMLIDRGLVLPVGEVDNHYLPVDKFELLRIDDSVVYKNISDIKVVDRSHLYPGQLVGSASDMGGQIGVITGVNTMLNLAKLDNKGLPIKVIRGVSPSSLRRIRSLNLGDFVVSGPWLGRVVEVSIDIDVLFDDGAVCRVSDAESKNLVGVRENRHSRRRCQMNSIFHQGLSVGGPDACSIFKAARWLNGYWHPQRDLGTIMKLETFGVLVYWVASMHYGTDKELLEASAPPAYQNPDDLTFFCASYDCCWGLADRCFFLETSSNEGGAACSPDQHDDNDDDDEEEEEEEEEEYNACSEDNQEECEASTSQVVPPTKQKDARFYRKQLRKFVFEGHRRAQRSQVMRHVEHVVANVLPVNAAVDATDDLTATSVNNNIAASGTGPTEHVGIVKSMQYEHQTVCVSWFKTPGHPDEAREVECDDIVSAYDLRLDSNHSAYYGDIVIRILPSVSTDGGESAPLLQGNKKKNAVPADLSWVGRVVELPNGHVQVKWGDGSMSTVSPHEIVVVKDENYMELWLEMGDWVEDDGIDDAPEEPVAANTPGNVKDKTFRFFIPVFAPIDQRRGGSRSALWITATLTLRTRKCRALVVRRVGLKLCKRNEKFWRTTYQLPPSYPDAPPQVYYHSFGLRLNPNLYESGNDDKGIVITGSGQRPKTKFSLGSVPRNPPNNICTISTAFKAPDHAAEIRRLTATTSVTVGSLAHQPLPECATTGA
uniref:Uncharacterized protein n=1 Tax=Aegilops tauschii TaxID=37682 RepID=N1R395_AEGTA